MHRRFLSRLIRAACGALPALGALGTTPTAAHSIPASFDCAQAGENDDPFRGSDQFGGARNVVGMRRNR